MNGTEETKHRPRFLSAIFVAIAMVLTVLAGSGIITSTAAAASADAVDVELVPHYKDVTYVLDPVTFVQRFDALGDWEKIGNVELSDSRLVMDMNEGATLEIEDNLANYFETRLMFDSTNADVSFKLSDGTNYTSIILAHDGAINASYAKEGSTQVVEIDADGAVKGEWIKVSIEFTETSIIFRASGADGLLGTQTVEDALLTFDEVTSVEIRASGTGAVAYADYCFASLTRTDFVAATIAGDDINARPELEKKFQKFMVEFGQKEMEPGTFSDEALTHELYGGELSTKTLASDRYLNQSDMGELLAKHKETNTKITGTATYQGWSNLQRSNEDALQEFLADEHDVSRESVTIIDYYMDGASLNYSFNKATVEAVEKAWLKYATEMADELGAQTAYNDEAAVANSIYGTMALAIGKKPSDLNYFYYPTSVDAKEFDKAMDDLSDKLREKTIGALVMLPETFENMTVASKTNPDAYALSVGGDGSIWNNAMQKLDKAYQATDAALGQMLQGATYMLFDLDAMGDAMGWSIMKDGKLTSSPLTFAQVYGSEVVAYGALGLLIAIPIVALLVVGGVFGAKKVRARKKQ